MKITSYILLVAIFLSYNLYGQTKKAAFNKSKDAVVKILASELPEIGFRSNGGSGTGYIASSDGYIITNHHVIDGAVVINVIVSKDNKSDTIPAYTLWSDSDMDMAVLKVDRTNLPYLEFENEDKINQGDEVLAIGYPGGSKDVKVTWGIISGMPNDSTLNTTAALNSGNSGGPCVNLNGKVVGTIFAKKVSISVEGAGFLRAVDYALKAIEDAKKEAKDFKEITGTESKEAYLELCKAETAFININYKEEDADRSAMLDKALAHIDKALAYDSNYILAYFYKASYELFYAFYQCELDQEDNSVKYAENFYASLSKARELDLDDGKYDNYNERIDNQLNLFLDGYEVDCEEWNEVLDEVQKSFAKRDDRMRDFDNYIRRGERPEMLADMIGAVEKASKREKTYNFGVFASVSWIQSMDHNDGPDKYVGDGWNEPVQKISNPSYLTDVNLRYGFNFNFYSFGIGYTGFMGDEINDGDNLRVITLRYSYVELDLNIGNMEGALTAIAPGFRLKYVSPGFYSPSGTGYKLGLGYHNLGFDNYDYPFFEKLSINTEIRSRVLGFPLSFNSQIIPGKYLQIGFGSYLYF